MPYKLNKSIINDVINYTFSTNDHISLKPCLKGIVGYVNFLDDNTAFVNIEGSSYSKNKKTIHLGDFFDLNTICITGLNKTKQPLLKMNPVIKDYVSRIAHNCCPFWDKTHQNLLAIGGRNEGKITKGNEIIHKHNQGLYISQAKDLDKGSWQLLHKGKPVISEDTLSNFKKTASFDSQISCIYSTLLKKYVLSVRCNIRKGHRYFSIVHSDDYIQWSNFISPQLNPPFSIASEDQLYSVLIHEYLPKKIFFGLCTFYNEKEKIYGAKMLISKDTIEWDDLGLLFNYPPSRMPRQRKKYSRPKINCGGIFSDSNGNITFYFYIYKQYNTISYFSKTYKFDDIFISE